MTTYLTSTHDMDDSRVVRGTQHETIVMATPEINGGGGVDTTTPPGPGGTPPAAAVGYLWPRGDGTPAAT